MSFEMRGIFGEGFKIGGDKDKGGDKKTDALLERLVGCLEKLIQNQEGAGHQCQGAGQEAALRWQQLMNQTVGNIGYNPQVNLNATVINNIR